MKSGLSESDKKRKKIKFFTKFLFVLFLVLLIGGFYLYNNFNKLLSEALLKSFNSNIVSDVYELKFEKLSVNFFDGDVRVHNVILSPREKPLNNYPYINSSFVLKTEKILLTNVQLFKLIKENELELDDIEIIKPDIDLTLEGKINVLFPVKDTTYAKEKTHKKKFIESFLLRKFQLADASFKVSNSYKERGFSIKNFNITLNDILISQKVGRDLFSYKLFDLSIGQFAGTMQKGPMKQISFSDYHLKIDSLNIDKTLDTLIYRFANLSTSIKSLDIQTADSIFHVQMKSFDLSYKDKSIKITGIGFTPNMPFAQLQKKYKFQHTDFSVEVGSLDIVNMNFDSLIYGRMLFIDKIILDKVTAAIYKDNTKEMDLSRIPGYFGQQIMSVKMPLKINEVEVRNINLVNTERKRDSTLAIVKLNKGTVKVKNITNDLSVEELSMNVEAYLENKVRFVLDLGFNYRKPQFTFDGDFGKFNLPDLNPVLLAYTPAKINQGTADQIKFNGIIYRTNSTGTMKFLYHDLEVDLQLNNKAKWKSAVGAFAANSYLPSANPASADLPPRIVQFKAERIMNKGFINIIIKSVLQGLKETVYMSKENRKAYKQEKKKTRNKSKDSSK